MAQPGEFPAPVDCRLSGWKAIAAHVNRGVRTVQRREREVGPPVHRGDR